MAIGRSKVVIIGAGNVGYCSGSSSCNLQHLQQSSANQQKCRKSVGRSHRLESLCGILR